MNEDPLDLVVALAPAVTPDSEVLARVRSTVMETLSAPDPSVEPDPIPIDGRRHKPRRTRRRIASIAAAAIALAGATGTAWAVMAHRDSAQTTTLSCPTPAGPNTETVDPDAHTIVDVVSGDPVADCAAAWAKQSSAAAPKMAAYDNGHGAVVVIAAGTAVPEGYTPIQPGTYQRADAAALQRHLDDVATGIEARCYDLAGAQSRAKIILADLDLTGWTVAQGHPGRVADGTRNCAAASVDPATGTVEILGAGRQGHHPFGDFATEVHHAVESSCVGTDDATKLVRAIAERTTVDNGGTRVDLADPGVVDITTVPRPAASCATVTVTLGGNIAVTLEGPK